MRQVSNDGTCTGNVTHRSVVPETGRKFRKEGTYINIQPVHFAVQETLTQLCKATTFQLKIFLKDTNSEVRWSGCKSWRYPLTLNITEALVKALKLSFSFHIVKTKAIPGSSVGKESTCNGGDPGLIPGLGRSPGEGTGLPTPVFLGFPGGACLQCGRPGFDPWVGNIPLRERFPRQVDKKSRGAQGKRGLEFSRRKKGQTFFSPLHPSGLYNNNVSCLSTVSGKNLLANPLILKCKLWE